MRKNLHKIIYLLAFVLVFDAYDIYFKHNYNLFTLTNTHFKSNYTSRSISV